MWSPIISVIYLLIYTMYSLKQLLLLKMLKISTSAQFLSDY